MNCEKWKPIVQSMLNITDDKKIDFLAQYAEHSAILKDQLVGGEILTTPLNHTMLMMIPLELKVLSHLDYNNISILPTPDETKTVVTKVDIHRTLGVAAITYPNYMNMVASAIAETLRTAFEKQSHVYLYLVVSHYSIDADNGKILYFSRFL